MKWKKMKDKSFINKLINPCPTSYNSLRLSSTSQKNIKKVFSAFHRNTGIFFSVSGFFLVLV